MEYEINRNELQAAAYAGTVVTRGTGDTAARRSWGEMENAVEGQRVELYKNAPTAVGIAMAIQQLAGKIQTIQHLNITPELFGSLFEDMLKDRGGKSGGGQAT